MPLPQNRRPSGATPSKNQVRAPQPSYPAPTSPSRPRPTAPRPVAPQQPANGGDGNDDMSFDFNDDGFAMSNEPVNPVAPARTPASPDYMARRQSELSPNARNPFAVPDSKQDGFTPEPPRPVSSSHAQRQEGNAPATAATVGNDSNAGIAGTSGNKPNPGSPKADEEPEVDEAKPWQTPAGNAGNASGSKKASTSVTDLGADLGAVSVGLGSSVVASSIMMLGFFISVQSGNWNVLKYAGFAVLIGLPVLALVAAVVALLKRQGSKIAAIVGIVLSVFTLFTCVYARAEVSSISEKLQKQASSAMEGFFGGGMSMTGGTTDGSASDSSSSYYDSSDSSSYDDGSVQWEDDGWDDASSDSGSASADAGTDAPTDTASADAGGDATQAEPSPSPAPDAATPEQTE